MTINVFHNILSYDVRLKIFIHFEFLYLQKRWFNCCFDFTSVLSSCTLKTWKLKKNLLDFKGRFFSQIWTHRKLKSKEMTVKQRPSFTERSTDEAPKEAITTRAGQNNSTGYTQTQWQARQLVLNWVMVTLVIYSCSKVRRRVETDTRRRRPHSCSRHDTSVRTSSTIQLVIQMRTSGTTHQLSNAERRGR
jgi:hypothetical protein